jgi:cyclopropane fatty-acyl-phospholipid synthase-like methyltransferase
MSNKVKIMPQVDEKILQKFNIDELTIKFMERIHLDHIKLIEGIEYLINEDFDTFTKNLQEVLEATEEIKIKKAFEAKIWKAKLMFSKADRIKILKETNDIKTLGESLASKLLLYRIIFPDEEFKLSMKLILKSLKAISNNLAEAVKLVGTDLTKSHNLCEEVKEERRRMRKEERQLLQRLWNYDMDYLSRTFLYLKELIEGIMALGEHIKDFAEFIQFLATKYLIFE